MVKAQEWLDTNYPEKNQVKTIELDDELEGELTISDFPQLEEIKKKTEGEKNIAELTINNCPSLKRINCYLCRKIKELTITGCPQISEINCDTNQIENLELSEFAELKRLNCSNNRLTSLDVSKNKQLVQFVCEKNKITKLNLDNNPLITFLDISNNPLVHSPYFFPKKKKVETQKLRQKLTENEQNLVNSQEENEDKELLIVNLESNIELLEERMVEIVNLKSKEIDELQINLQILQGELIEEKERNWTILQELEKLREEQKDVKQVKFERLLINLKNKLSSNLQELLDDLLEAKVESFTNNNPFVKRQVDKIKQRILKSGEVSEKELDDICQNQEELVKLEKKPKLEAKIEVNIN